MRKLCIWDLQCFQTFRNGCLFCTFWLIRNLNCADSHHSSYCERFSIHHFQHCAQCVYENYSFFKVFQIAISFAHFFLLGNFYSGDAPHANYGKYYLTHHFQHCAHCVYEIYSIFKVFEIAVCFAHFVVFEIWNPWILTMLAMVNVVQIIISNIAHSVYMRFTVFSKFSKFLVFLHILGYSKFLLRSWATS